MNARNTTVQKILDVIFHNRAGWPTRVISKDKYQQIEALIAEAVREASEVFVPVRGAEGCYEVSNTGKVRSVLGGRRKGIELKQSPRNKGTNRGYLVVSLVKNGKVMSYPVHRLVATAFISNPEGKRTVNHKDGNKQNNYMSNLEWATHAENEQHSHRELGKKVWNKDTADYTTTPCLNCGKPITDRTWKKRKYCDKHCQLKHTNPMHQLQARGEKKG